MILERLEKIDSRAEGQQTGLNARLARVSRNPMGDT